jgi:hypothetical protein
VIFYNLILEMPKDITIKIKNLKKGDKIYEVFNVVDEKDNLVEC